MKKYTVLFIFFSIEILCYGQTQLIKSKDSILSVFLLSKEVTGDMQKCNIESPDGVLYILDPNKICIKSNLNIWLNLSVQIISSGKLIDSLNQFEANYFLATRRNYIVIRESKSKNGIKIYLHHPSDNRIIYARLNKTKKGYSLGRFYFGVI